MTPEGRAAVEQIAEQAKAEAAILKWKAGTLPDGDDKMLLDQIVAQAVEAERERIMLLIGGMDLGVENQMAKALAAALRAEAEGQHCTKCGEPHGGSCPYEPKPTGGVSA
jgi:hypothetical protein